MLRHVDLLVDQTDTTTAVHLVQFPRFLFTKAGGDVIAVQGIDEEAVVLLADARTEELVVCHHRTHNDKHEEDDNGAQRSHIETHVGGQLFVVPALSK